MPSALKDSRACKPTRPMPRYISDGSGRDIIIAFNGDPLPPKFNNFYSENRPHKMPSKDKRPPVKVPATPKFVPDGSGRDLFQQQNSDYVCPVNINISTQSIVPKKKGVSYYKRPMAKPRFTPSGSGRDMGYSDIDVQRTINSQNSFKVLKPTYSNSQILRPRTSPPPRFQSTGSGRDNFQNPSAHRPASSYNPQREGFAYGSPTISQNARYKYGKSSRSYSAQAEAMKRLAAPSRNNSKTAKFKRSNNLDEYFR